MTHCVQRASSNETVFFAYPERVVIEMILDQDKDRVLQEGYETTHSPNSTVHTAEVLHGKSEIIRYTLILNKYLCI